MRFVSIFVVKYFLNAKGSELKYFKNIDVEPGEITLKSSRINILKHYQNHYPNQIFLKS